MTDELLLSQDRTPVRLGPELARGGEGIVYSLFGAPDRLAKVYLQPATSDRATKLGVMSGLVQGTLQKVAAWPEEIVVDRQGRTRGFLNHPMKA